MRLQTNAGKFGIKTFNLAISDKDGTLECVSGAVSHVFTSVEHATDYSIMNERQVVNCKRLDSIAIEGRSLVLKIDVEGQELEVLRGAESLLRSGRVKALYLDGYAQPGVPEILLQHGFSLYDGRTLEAYDGFSHSVLAINNCAPQTSPAT